jgi:hypothetical protein
MNHTNLQKKISNAMLIVMLAGVLLIILFLTKVHNNDFSLILFLVPGLLATTIGLIFYFVYKYQAEQYEKILQSNNYLARWKVDNFVWTNFIEKDYNLSSKKSYEMGKYSLFIIVPLIVICGFMMENTVEIIFCSATVLGCVALTGFLIYFFNKQKYISRKNIGSADIIVTEKALIINSEFYNWSVWGSRFEYLKYLEDENMLQFVYSVSSKSGRVNQEINVPIGNSEQEQLNKIREHFSDKIKA